MSNSLITAVQDWLRDMPAEILFLAALPFAIAALALLADSARRRPAD